MSAPHDETEALAVTPLAQLAAETRPGGSVLGRPHVSDRGTSATLGRDRRGDLIAIEPLPRGRASQALAPILVGALTVDVPRARIAAAGAGACGDSARGAEPLRVRGSAAEFRTSSAAAGTGTGTGTGAASDGHDGLRWHVAIEEEGEEQQLWPPRVAVWNSPIVLSAEHFA